MKLLLSLLTCSLILSNSSFAQNLAEGATKKKTHKHYAHRAFRTGHVTTPTKKTEGTGEDDGDNDDDDIVTPASPALLFVDDAGVPDPGQVEANFTFDGEFNRKEKELETPLYDLNMGMVIFGKRVQLKYEVPTTFSKDEDEKNFEPIADSKLGLKFPVPFLDNFIHRFADGVELATYPQIQFHTPGSNSTEGPVAELPVIIQRSFKHLKINGVDLGPISVVANLGYSRAIPTQKVPHPEDLEEWSAGAGFAKKVSPRLNMMAEVGSSFTPGSKKPEFVATTVGVMYRIVNEKLYIYSDAGVDLYRKDGENRFYLSGGLKWLFQSNLGKNHLVGKLFREPTQAK